MALKTNYEKLKEKKIRDGVGEEIAKVKAYAVILHKLQKEFERIYMGRLLWVKWFRAQETSDAFIIINKDGFDKEALEAAIDKRKFLFKQLLKHHTFSENKENSTPDNSLLMCCIFKRVKLYYYM